MFGMVMSLSQLSTSCSGNGQNCSGATYVNVAMGAVSHYLHHDGFVTTLTELVCYAYWFGIGMLTFAVCIALAERLRKERQAVKTDAHLDTSSMQDETTEEPKLEVSQSELDWITSARVGEIRLTDDVLCTAMQWWLDGPAFTMLDHLALGDQRLLRPVEKLLQEGRQKEAHELMEQIGRLDKMERELQHQRRTKRATPAIIGTPLGRSSPTLGVAATRMRSAIETRVPSSDLAHGKSLSQPQNIWSCQSSRRVDKSLPSDRSLAAKRTSVKSPLFSQGASSTRAARQLDCPSASRCWAAYGA
jgi:hypothetical protein